MGCNQSLTVKIFFELKKNCIALHALPLVCHDAPKQACQQPASSRFLLSWDQVTWSNWITLEGVGSHQYYGGIGPESTAMHDGVFCWQTRPTADDLAARPNSDGNLCTRRRLQGKSSCSDVPRQSAKLWLRLWPWLVFPLFFSSCYNATGLTHSVGAICYFWASSDHWLEQ